MYNIRKAENIRDAELFKKLNENIWEFRTRYNKTQYRLLAFWDRRDKQETLVIAVHGFIKKTSKTPSQELERAESIRERYFDEA